MKRRQNPVPKLLEFYDLRDFDFDTGKYLPLRAGEGAICERCGREHAKVYVVQTVTGEVKSVGSGCCKRAFEGWEPSALELKTARAAFREKREATRKAVLAELAAPLVAALDAMAIPDWRFIRKGSDVGRYVFGDPDLGVEVWTDDDDAAEVRQKGDKAERVQTYMGSWLSAAAGRLPLEVRKGFRRDEIVRAALHAAQEHRSFQDREGIYYMQRRPVA